MRLPTDFLFGVTGVSVAYDGRDLVVVMPTRLVLDRRYAMARVTQHGARAYAVDVELYHREPYAGPVPGRNAWQEKTTPYAGCPSTRTLDQRRANMHAGTEEAALRRLHSLTMGGPAGHSRVLVRVTPEGFQLRVFRDAEAMRGQGSPYYDRPDGMDRCGSHMPLGVRNDRLYQVRPELRHADALEYGTETGRWRGRGFLPPQAMPINCRSRLVENVTQAIAHDNHLYDAVPYLSTENETMKTDTTTSDTLPFGLAAGQKIVQVSFSDGSASEYAYFDGGLDLQVGDFAVVASPYGDSNGGIHDDESGGYLKVVRVVSVDPNVEGIRKVAKWIVAKVDVSEYRSRRKRIEDLKAIDAQIALAEREARKALEMSKLRELSPELAALIDAREALAKG